MEMDKLATNANLNVPVDVIWSNVLQINQKASHDSQSKTYESPFPLQGYQGPQAQKRSVQGHRFSCKQK